MLVIGGAIRRARGPRPADEGGAVLVAVLVVMLVGFIVASAVAASTIFAIQTNAGNRSNTQAFVSAESGRDVAAAALAAGCSATTFSGDDPTYSSTVYVTAGDQPESSTSAGVAVGCPTETTRYVVIRSVGTGADGSTATVESVYPWLVSSSEEIGGVMTYFAGGYTTGVAHYTGDLVLRKGNWACNIDGVLNGDLYVLEGSVSLSNGCTINGDVWAEGNVFSNSQRITITGNITTNGSVEISANGGAQIGGSITAKGTVTLSDQGSTPAQVSGGVTSRGTIAVGSLWTVAGAQTPGSPDDPVFDPSLEWLRSATQWIDLDNTNWGPAYTASNVCDLLRNNPDPSIASLVATAGDPLVLDFTTCGSAAVGVALGGITVRRDVVMIAEPSARLDVSVAGPLSDDGNKRQLMFVQSDASRAYVDGQPAPHCGNGNQNNKFGVSGSIDADLRIMIYSACGITGTATSSFSGQYYTNDSLHMHSSAEYTCRSMAWSPAFGTLGCTIDGPDGITETVTTQQLGSLVYQTER